MLKDWVKEVNWALKLAFAFRALAKPQVPEGHLYSEFKGFRTENKCRPHPNMGPKNVESLKGSILVKEKENGLSPFMPWRETSQYTYPTPPTEEMNGHQLARMLVCSQDHTSCMARKTSSQEFSFTWFHTTNVTSEKQVHMYFWKNPPQLMLWRRFCSCEALWKCVAHTWKLLYTQGPQGRASRNTILQNMLLKKPWPLESSGKILKNHG